MNFQKSIFFLLFFALVFIGCKKDPCKDSPCLNGGVCSSVNDEAVCACGSDYEGDICDQGINAKFVGSYSIAETSNGSTYSFPCNVMTGASLRKLVFDNLGYFEDTMYANIDADKVGFVVEEFTFQSGYKFNGFGHFVSSTELYAEYWTQDLVGDTAFYATAIMTRQ